MLFNVGSLSLCEIRILFSILPDEKYPRNMTQIAATAAICKILSIVLAGTTIIYSQKPHGTCTHCCPIREPDDIQFLLYTRNNPNKAYKLLLGDDISLYNSYLQFNKPLAVFIHGFLESATLPNRFSQVIKNAFLYAGDYNVILVDWSAVVSAPWYVTAVRNVPLASRYIARFLQYLIGRGYPVEQIHLIGFSLGGQAAGYVGRELQKSGILLPRITGLDPAYPLYANGLNSPLRPEDAYFVDVIHTDGGVEGHISPLGHADFFPNGGIPLQPGCVQQAINGSSRVGGLLLLAGICSHQRVWMYFAESVQFPQAFPAGRCEPRKKFPVCEDLDGEAYMGIAADSRLRGKFYLETNESPPYGRNTPSTVHIAGLPPPESALTPTIMTMWQKAVQKQMSGRETDVDKINFIASRDFPKTFFEFVSPLK